MPRPTWVATRLDRARRRLRPAPAPTPDEAVEDIAISLVRPELERLMTALASPLHPGLPRPDSPARLASALSAAIAQVQGRGEPAVIRSPAGLYTPEYWHIRIAGSDDRTRALMARLTGTELR